MIQNTLLHMLVTHPHTICATCLLCTHKLLSGRQFTTASPCDKLHEQATRVHLLSFFADVVTVRITSCTAQQQEVQSLLLPSSVYSLTDPLQPNRIHSCLYRKTL